MKLRLKANLELLLRQRGITASKLATSAGVSKSSLSDWGAGRPPRSLEQLKKVCETLGVTVDQILFSDLSEKPDGASSLNQAEALSALMGDEWISGKFEVKIRKLK